MTKSNPKLSCCNSGHHWGPHVLWIVLWALFVDLKSIRSTVILRVLPMSIKPPNIHLHQLTVWRADSCLDQLTRFSWNNSGCWKVGWFKKYSFKFILYIRRGKLERCLYWLDSLFFMAVRQSLYYVHCCKHQYAWSEY